MLILYSTMPSGVIFDLSLWLSKAQIGGKAGQALGIIFTEVAKVRTRITLACTVCKQRNYDNMKNKKNDPDRIELKKYCRFCRKHTVHKETK